MIPTQYQWLESLPQLPKTIELGLNYYGTAEVVGKGSNKTIISWRDILNGAAPAGSPIVQGYSDDDIPWCGLFVAIIAYLRQRNISEVVTNPLWAANWANYGKPVSIRKGGKLSSINGLVPSLGDVMVFERPKGNHVAFYVGEDPTHYHILGGNQSNRVTITRILKSRCWSVRRPLYRTIPSSVKPYHLAATGTVSHNEA